MAEKHHKRHRSHHYHHHHHSSEGRSGRRKIKKGPLLIFAAALILIIIGGGILFRMLDEQELSSVADDERRLREVEIGGVRCRPKTRIKSYLFLGIDTWGTADSSEEYDGTGQCDVLELLVIDQNENTYAVLPINRNTITAVKTLNPDGSVIATSDVQIAIAHANGDGMEISCENTVDAVSHLLYDQPIDGYCALNMDSILVLNHSVGGVTVTIEDDFGTYDPDLKMGETIRLTDKQAEHFIRGRMEVADGTNENRMVRQKVYLETYKEMMMEQAGQNEQFVLDLYDGLQPYMCTTFSKKDCSKITKAVLKNRDLGTMEIDGITDIDYHGLYEFLPDEKSLQDVVIDLFYEKL